MILKGIVYFLLIIAFVTPTFAQQELTGSKRFFKTKVAEYNDWQEASFLGDVITVEDYEVGKNIISLTLAPIGPYRNPEILASTWIDMREQLLLDTGLGLEKFLWQKIAHTLEVAPGQLSVEVVGLPRDLFTVSFSYSGSGFEVVDQMDEIRGNKEKFVIDKEELDGLITLGRVGTMGEIEPLKQLLLQGIEGHFLRADSRFGSEPRVEILRDGSSEFTLLVSNVTNQIITKYFELINFNLEIEPVDGGLEVAYTVFGKYSSGIFVAPRSTSSDYKDMFPEYSAELDIYIDRIGRKIRELLKEKG